MPALINNSIDNPLSDIFKPWEYIEISNILSYRMKGRFARLFYQSNY